MFSPRTVAAFAVLCLAVVCAHAAADGPPKTLTQKTNGLYHTTQEILAAVRLMKKLGCEIKAASKSETGTRADGSSYDVTVEAIDLGPQGSKHEHDKKVLLFFGEHARELIPTEIALYLVLQYCEAQVLGVMTPETADGVSAKRRLAYYTMVDTAQCKTNAATADQELCQKTASVVREIRQRGLLFRIVLVANPLGRQMVENGNFCQRLNENEVDLNRNWQNIANELLLGAEEKPPRASLPQSMEGESRGVVPFSEPETRALKAIAEHFGDSATFMTIHSGYRSMFMPWGSIDVRETDRNGPQHRMILQCLVQDANTQSPFGSVPEVLEYTSPRNAFDWIFKNLEPEYAFAFEVYTGDKDQQADALRKYNKQFFASPADAQQAQQTGFVQAAAKVAKSAAKKKTATKQQQEQASMEPDSLQYEAMLQQLEKASKSAPASFLQINSHASDTQRAAHGPSDDERNNECLNSYNPTSQAEYDSTVRRWLYAILRASQVSTDLASRRQLEVDAALCKCFRSVPGSVQHGDYSNEGRFGVDAEAHRLLIQDDKCNLTGRQTPATQ